MKNSDTTHTRFSRYSSSSFTVIKRNDGDGNSLYGSRDSLVSSARTKDEVEGKSSLTRSYSDDKDEEKGWMSSSTKTG